ncbi:hypothetical protein V6N13_014810 [Hibiscus sabdariffa]
MKLAFNLLAKQDQLWVLFIRDKYNCPESSVEISNCWYTSKLWKGIVLVWSDVCSNISWCISNGKEVDFWFDSWLSDQGPLIDHTIAAGAIGVQRATVVDMLDANGEWRWNLFQQLWLIPVLLSKFFR